MKRFPAVSLLLGAVGWVFLAAASLPDYSGVWVLAKERSSLTGPLQAIDKGVVMIAQQGGRFSFQRVFSTGGQEDAFAFELTIDDPEVAGQEGPLKTFSKLYREGDALVYHVRMQAPQGQANNVVRYSLQEDGQMLVARESFRGPRLRYDNVWVFAKQR